MFSGAYDFGYPWWMTWGHLLPFAIFGLVALAAWRFGGPRWLVVLAALGSIWGLAGMLITSLVLTPNLPIQMPTPSFLPGGAGRVLDLGAGSGRASLMVLLERPQTTVVALDIYSGYWGITDNTPERLKGNAAAAGVDARLEVQVGDMRKLPFPDASFDAAVSSFAIDHLRRSEIPDALKGVARVLKPGGHILIMNLRPDIWIRVAIPALPNHSYFSREQDVAWWRTALADAGFDVVEVGTQPGTNYFLGARRGN